MSDVIRLNRGGDYVLPVTWPSGPGETAPGANLTGFVVGLIDVSPEADGHLSINPVDLTVGRFDLVVSDQLGADGVAQHRCRFVLTHTATGARTPGPLMTILLT